MPLFGSLSVPLLVRIGLAALLAWLLLPVTVGPPGQPAGLPGIGWTAGWVLLAAKEVLVGLVMAWAVQLVFAAVQMAGTLADVPLGFGMVNVIDPHQELHAPLLAGFHSLLAGLLFFVTEGHHVLLRAVAESFRWLPAGALPPGGPPLEAVVRTFAGSFAAGVQLSLPVVAVSFLADGIMGVLARAVPQINVFITGFSVKIVLGLGVLLLALPWVVGFVGRAFGPGGLLLEWLEGLLGGMR